MTATSSTSLSPEEALELTNALSDPTRYGIYRAIVEAAGETLTVADVAKRFSLHRNVARTHLQKLVGAGLVHADTRKSRAGGRPARIYRLSERVANLQFPPRDYQLLALLALQVVQSLTTEEPGALERVGFKMGREEGKRSLRQDAVDPGENSREQLLRSLQNTCARLGLFPRVRCGTGELVQFEIRNCVFRELSARYPELVCTLHTAMLRGILKEYQVEARLEARPAICAGDPACIFSLRLP